MACNRLRRRHVPANLCGICGMPCPANELGGIGPCVAAENSRANSASALCDGWDAVACGAFGHGVPCPYWRTARTRNVVAVVPSICGCAVCCLRRRLKPTLLKGGAAASGIRLVVCFMTTYLIQYTN